MLFIVLCFIFLYSKCAAVQYTKQPGITVNMDIGSTDLFNFLYQLYYGTRNRASWRANLKITLFFLSACHSQKLK